MKLNGMNKITGKIELLTGLHIGSGNTEMHIGGTDNPVIKNPETQQPYIPGSSIKGRRNNKPTNPACLFTSAQTISSRCVEPLCAS